MKVAPGSTKIAPGGSYSAKSTKNNVFREQNTPASLGGSPSSSGGFLTVTQKLSCFNVSCLEAIHAPPGAAYSSGKNPKVFCICVIPKTPNQKF